MILGLKPVELVVAILILFAVICFWLVNSNRN
jgi:hypothetical protein